MGTGIGSTDDESTRADAAWDLDELARARGLADWMFEQFADAARGRVIEVGAGIGTFSGRLLGAGVSDLLLIEPDPACAAVLRERFGGDHSVRIAEEALPDSPQLRAASGTADFVLCQNVLEHIDDDREAIAAMAAALKPGGRLTVLVPANPRLYGSIDRAFGHRRRYEPGRLIALAEVADLRIRDVHPFNALGILGWWTRSRLGLKSLGSRSLAVYEAVLPLWRPIERRVRPPRGLSLILHAERPT